MTSEICKCGHNHFCIRDDCKTHHKKCKDCPCKKFVPVFEKKKFIMYPIQVVEDLRGKLDLIGKENLICNFSFDKWNNLLLIEVRE